MTPEARARQTIDALLTAAGWHVCDVASANLHAGSGAVKGLAIRESPLNPGHGFADYLLYVNGKACGVIEATEQGATLSGVEVQSARYAQGLPAALARTTKVQSNTDMNRATPPLQAVFTMASRFSALM